MRSIGRPVLIRWALFLPLPAAPLAVVLAARTDPVATALAVWGGMAVLAALVGPPAGLHRDEAAALVGVTVLACFVAVPVWLVVGLLALCTRSWGFIVTSGAAGLATYLAAAGAALADDEPAVRVLGLPVALALGFAVSLAVLAVLTGGPHACAS